MNVHGPSLGIGAGIAVISILAAFFAMDSLVSSTQPLLIEDSTVKPTVQPSSTPDTPQEISSAIFTNNASPILGDKNAPITLVEFGDYQCFFCNKFFHETEEKIVNEYVRTGKVKIIFKDYTIIGPDSITAAHGSHCADEQGLGLFWDYHDILYDNWNGENNGWASPENIVGFARDLDLDIDQFTECMQEKRHQSKITASNQDASTLGLTGTPAFFVIGKDNQISKIQGAQPYEVFQRIFDSELEK